VRGVPAARWLLDLSELGGVLMSIVSGESAIGSIGLAMALTRRQRDPYKLKVEAIPRAENYLRGKTRLYG
jgi:hypothetical protein